MTPPSARAQHGVLGAPKTHGAHATYQGKFKERRPRRPAHGDLAHVREVKEPGRRAHRHVFRDVAGVAHGHFPAGEVNERGAERNVLGVQGRAERGHGTTLLHARRYFTGGATSQAAVLRAARAGSALAVDQCHNPDDRRGHDRGGEPNDDRRGDEAPVPRRFATRTCLDRVLDTNVHGHWGGGLGLQGRHGRQRSRHVLLGRRAKGAAFRDRTAKGPWRQWREAWTCAQAPWRPRRRRVGTTWSHRRCPRRP